MRKLFLLAASVAFAAAPTVDDARKFLDDAEKNLLILNVESNRADWVHANFITYDTEALSAARGSSGPSTKACGWPKARRASIM